MPRRTLTIFSYLFTVFFFFEVWSAHFIAAKNVAKKK